jgi:hypothetical protein
MLVQRGVDVVKKAVADADVLCCCRGAWPLIVFLGDIWRVAVVASVRYLNVSIFAHLAYHSSVVLSAYPQTSDPTLGT